MVSDSPLPDVLRLRLDRPACRNALDQPLVRALLNAIRGLDARVVILGTTSTAAFSAGADLRLQDQDRSEVSDLLYELYECMLTVSAPIIVAMPGHTVGGGAQIMLAADLRIGAPNSAIRFVGPAHGLAVGAWGLPSLVGRGRAMQLMLSMRAVGAQEALSIGLVDMIADDPDDAATNLASELLKLDRDALTRLKRVVAMAGNLVEALRLERRGNAEEWSGSINGPKRD